MTTKHEHEHAPTHAHAATHEHAATRDATPDVPTAARNLYTAALRLGPRITEHGYGCPAGAAGPCTCGSVDFQGAMRDLAAALTPEIPA